MPGIPNPLDFEDAAADRLDGLEYGIVGLDAAGIVLLVNRALRGLTGIAADTAAVGRDFFGDLAPCTNLPAFRGRFLDGVRRQRLDESFAFTFGLETGNVRSRVRMAGPGRSGRYWIAVEPLERLPAGGTREAAEVIARRLAGEPVDSAACADEPIHVPGSIQPHGVLLTADPAGLIVTACSANAAEAFGEAAPALVGRPLDGLVPDTLAAAIRHRLADGSLDGRRPLRRSVLLGGPPGGPLDGPRGDPERRWLAQVHAHDGRVVLELEMEPPAEAFPVPDHDDLREAIERLRGAATPEAATGVVAREARVMSGFERVLVYCFDHDWNGDAVAEDCAGDCDSLAGLRFPESDIPRQARELYVRSRSRFVVNRDWAQVPLLAAAPEAGGPAAPEIAGRPVDLTYAQFRSLSPMHREYQRGLGVNGSMSLSIMVDGRLWGLLIGHHRRPHYVAPGTRAALASLVDAFAFRLQEIETQRVWSRQNAHLAVQGKLLQQMAGGDDFVGALTRGPTTLLDLFEAAGAAVVSGGDVVTLGRAPASAEVLRLADRLRLEPAGEPVFATDHLSGSYPPALRYRHLASGVLAAFVDSGRQHLLLWFRPEVTGTVVWGGNPRKRDDGAGGPTLPRRAQERWIEQRASFSEPWDGWQLESAVTLGRAIEGVILRQGRKIQAMSATQQELRSALADRENLLRQQDLLMREIDHRVMNSLQIVAGLLNLQGRTVKDAAARHAFAEAYGRVMGVARVHQSLYRSSDIQHVDLGQTISVLCEDLAKLGGANRQVRIEASAGVVVPSRVAVSLALVATELVTNALKYAYAADAEGIVDVTVEACGDTVRMVIADHGAGMPAAPDRAGGGLGMQLVRSILDEIQASMHVQTNGGTRFTIEM